MSRCPFLHWLRVDHWTRKRGFLVYQTSQKRIKKVLFWQQIQKRFRWFPPWTLSLTTTGRDPPRPKRAMSPTSPASPWKMQVENWAVLRFGTGTGVLLVVFEWMIGILPGRPWRTGQKAILDRQIHSEMMELNSPFCSSNSFVVSAKSAEMVGTRWCPSSFAKLVQIAPIARVCSRYFYLFIYAYTV